MFKALVAQRFYGLSDEQTEYWLMDRLSFQKFVGWTNGRSKAAAKARSSGMGKSELHLPERDRTTATRMSLA